MIKHFFHIYKNINWILSERQRKASKKAHERYQNLSEEKYKKQKKAHERYQNLSKGETDNKHQYYPKYYKNLPEYKKQSIKIIKVKILK